MAFAKMIEAASMRPGPIRPGDRSRRGQRPSADWHCFNEARADSPGRWESSRTNSRRFSTASMRPGPIRPGDTRHPGVAGLAPRASMRPGPIRPGDGTTGQRVGESASMLLYSPGRCPRGTASMRPGPIRPGELLFDGFNEARADPRRHPAASRAVACFNEARADSPGRW